MTVAELLTRRPGPSVPVREEKPFGGLPFGRGWTGTGSLATRTHVGRDLYHANLKLSYHVCRWVSRERIIRNGEIKEAMRRFFMQFAAVLLAVVLALPTALAAGERRRDGPGGPGLWQRCPGERQPGEQHRATARATAWATLDDDLDFVELAWTDRGRDPDHHGQDSEHLGETAPPTPTPTTAGDVIGCYHVLVESGYRSYEQAAADAQEYRGTAFVAWIDGDYQVRRRLLYQAGRRAEGRRPEPGRHGGRHQLLRRQRHPHRNRGDPVPV